jgi:hypothetical protein
VVDVVIAAVWLEERQRPEEAHQAALQGGGRPAVGRRQPPEAIIQTPARLGDARATSVHRFLSTHQPLLPTFTLLAMRPLTEGLFVVLLLLHARSSPQQENTFPKNISLNRTRLWGEKGGKICRQKGWPTAAIFSFSLSTKAPKSRRHCLPPQP